MKVMIGILGKWSEKSESSIVPKPEGPGPNTESNELCIPIHRE